MLDVIGVGLDPEIDIFRKSGCAVEDGGLPTNEQIGDAALFKVSEKACDHERLGDRAGVCAEPRIGADVRPA